MWPQLPLPHGARLLPGLGFGHRTEVGDEVGACQGEHSFPEEEILEKSSRGLIQAKRLHRA